MPLTAKGEKIKAAMVKQYGAKKGKQVFYASENKGTIRGVTKSGSSSSKKKKKNFGTQLRRSMKILKGY